MCLAPSSMKVRVGHGYNKGGKVHRTTIDLKRSGVVAIFFSSATTRQ